jgi:hypothetical protein
MKIDVEGMEEKVLAGAHRILRESKPLLFIEGNTQAEVDRHTAVLAPFGYRPTGRVFNASPTYEFAAADSPTAPPARLPRTVTLASWQADDPGLDAVTTDGGGLRITSRLAAGTHAHVTQPPLNLKRAPDQDVIAVSPSETYFLQAMGKVSEGTGVAFFVMEYDDRSRTATHKKYFHPRMFERIDLRPDTRRIRIAIQVTGAGDVALERVALHAIGGAAAAAAPDGPARRSWGARVARATRVALRRWIEDYRRSE